jgi:hypothetical protein
MGWSDPIAPQNRGPIPTGFGGHSRLLLLESAARVLAAQDEGIGEVVRQDARQNCKGGTKRKNGNQPKSVTIQARVEESVKTQLDQYAKILRLHSVLRHCGGAESQTG